MAKRPDKSLASRLDTKVTIEKPTIVPDGQGGFDTVWTEHVSVWGSVRPATAANVERAVANTTQGTITTLIETRWFPGLELTMRARWVDRWGAGSSPVQHTAGIRGFQNWHGASVTGTLLVEETAP